MMYHWNEKQRDPNEYNRNIHEPELKVRQPLEYTSTEPSHVSLPDPGPPPESSSPPNESSPDSAHESTKPPSKLSKQTSKSKKSKKKQQSSPDSTQEESSEPPPKPKPPSKSSKPAKKSHKHHDSSSDSSPEPPPKSKKPHRRSLTESEATSKSSRPPKTIEEPKIPPPLFGENGEVIPRPTDPQTGDPLPVYIKKDGKAIMKNGKPLTIKFFSDGKAMPFEKAYPDYPTKGQQAQNVTTQNVGRVQTRQQTGYAIDTDDGGGCCCCGGGNNRRRVDVSRRDSLDGRINPKAGALKVKTAATTAPATTTTMVYTYPQYGYGGYGYGGYGYGGYPYYGYGTDAALMGFAAGTMLGSYGWGWGGGFYDMFW